jgi:hypothetical protein
MDGVKLLPDCIVSIIHAMVPPTRAEWLLLAFIGYTVIGVVVGVIYGLFFADSVCCDDVYSFLDAIR